MTVLSFPFRPVAVLDDLYLSGVIDEVHLQYPEGHGIIRQGLVLQAKDGEQPFPAKPHGDVPVLNQRRPAALPGDPQEGGLFNILFAQLLRQDRSARKHRPAEELGKIFPAVPKQQSGGGILLHHLAGDLSGVSGIVRFGLFFILFHWHAPFHTDGRSTGPCMTGQALLRILSVDSSIEITLKNTRFSTEFLK